MIQLNLLPDVKKEFLHAQSARRKTIAVSILITIIAVGLTAVLAIYVYAVQNVITYAQTQDIKNKSNQLAQVKDIDKYLTIQNQLANLSSLHGGKNDFSRLLTFLPRLNPAQPQNVTLTSLEVLSEETTLTFKGTAKDFGSLTTFKDTLENASLLYTKEGASETKTKLFSEVTIDSAAYDGSGIAPGVTFTVIAKYDPEAFKQENQSVDVIVPTKETTGSVVGTPQEIFGGNQ